MRKRRAGFSRLSQTKRVTKNAWQRQEESSISKAQYIKKDLCPTFLLPTGDPRLISEEIEKEGIERKQLKEVCRSCRRDNVEGSESYFVLNRAGCANTHSDCMSQVVQTLSVEWNTGGGQQHAVVSAVSHHGIAQRQQHLQHKMYISNEAYVHNQ